MDVNPQKPPHGGAGQRAGEVYCELSGRRQTAESLSPGAGLGGYSLPAEVRFIIAEGEGGRLRAVDGREDDSGLRKPGCV